MFQENLQRALLHVQGARGAMLIGFDGIPIASLYAEGTSEGDTQLLEYAVELTHMIRKFNRTALDRGTPPIEEMSTTNHHQRTLARVVHGEFLLILAMEPGAESEAGGQMLKLLAPWVEREL